MNASPLRTPPQLTDAAKAMLTLARPLNVLDSASVECDGFVRLGSRLLTELDIPHRVYCGRLDGPTGTVPLHFWIMADAPDGSLLLADYRAKMWCGPKAPHGIQPVMPRGEEFLIGDYRYEGEEVEMGQLDETLFLILSDMTLDAAVEAACRGRPAPVA